MISIINSKKQLDSPTHHGKRVLCTSVVQSAEGASCQFVRSVRAERSCGALCRASCGASSCVVRCVHLWSVRRCVEGVSCVCGAPCGALLRSVVSSVVRRGAMLPSVVRSVLWSGASCALDAFMTGQGRIRVCGEVRPTKKDLADAVMERERENREGHRRQLGLNCV